MIQLGMTVKDSVSGFKGIASGRSTYLNGCDHICVQPLVKKDGVLPDAKWFDETQLAVVKKTKIGLPKKQNRKIGGPLTSDRSHSR